MNLQEIFIINMKRFRTGKKMTQGKLAELCNTDTAYIGQIETARRFPSIKYIERIAKALDVKAYELFKEQESDEAINARLQQEFKNELVTIIDRITTTFDIQPSELFKE